jgi:Werner syndrome ATP-dependent helicase
MLLTDIRVSLTVSCGEFLESSRPEIFAPPVPSHETSSSESFDQGPTIVYVPTRKGTVELANYLCKSGLKAAAYNAKVGTTYGTCYLFIRE